MYGNNIWFQKERLLTLRDLEGKDVCTHSRTCALTQCTRPCLSSPPLSEVFPSEIRSLSLWDQKSFPRSSSVVKSHAFSGEGIMSHVTCRSCTRVVAIYWYIRYITSEGVMSHVTCRSCTWNQSHLEKVWLEKAWLWFLEKAWLWFQVKESCRTWHVAHGHVSLPYIDIFDILHYMSHILRIYAIYYNTCRTRTRIMNSWIVSLPFISIYYNSCRIYCAYMPYITIHVAHEHVLWVCEWVDTYRCHPIRLTAFRRASLWLHTSFLWVSEEHVSWVRERVNTYRCLRSKSASLWRHKSFFLVSEVFPSCAHAPAPSAGACVCVCVYVWVCVCVRVCMCVCTWERKCVLRLVRDILRQGLCELVNEWESDWLIHELTKSFVMHRAQGALCECKNEWESDSVIHELTKSFVMHKAHFVSS